MSSGVELRKGAPGLATVAFFGDSSDNLIDTALYKQLCATLTSVGADPDVSVVVLESVGDTFSRGVDLSESTPGADVAGHWQQLYRGFVPAIWHNPKLVIAKVRGHALGVGCELALIADLTFADETARFGHPDTRRGFVGRTIWPYLVGPKISKEYLASGRLMPAELAAEFGLINKCVSADDLNQVTADYVDAALELPAGAIEMTKKRVGWAFRDVSRSLYDDLHYDMADSWTAASRSVDIAFYDRINEVGIQQALHERDQ